MNIGEALNAALASHRGNNLPGAKAGYDAVLAAMADNPDALYLRGMIHLVEGELEQGEALTRRAIAAKPDFPEALGNLGRIAAARGKPDLAIQIWQKALRLKPDEAEIRLDLGRALVAAARHADAVANLLVGLLQTPDDPALLLVLGNALQGQGQTEAAIATYRRGVALRPDNADHQHNLGVSLFGHHEIDAAIAQYRAALALRPADPDILNSLGAAQRANGDLDAAVTSYRAALAVAPAHAQALNNLGVVQTERRDLDDAVASYRAAIAADASAADPHYNLALTLLLAGQYRQGWTEMEWRWKTAAFRKQAQQFAVPAWTGDDADGGVVLLHDEQGLGDTIQFSRFVALAAQRARVVLQVQRPLLRLLAGLPGAVVYRFANTADAMWGYRGRYEWAGKFAARADDVLSWLPARLTALLLWPAPRCWQLLRIEATRTPSPNGGWPIGAMALRLGVRLRKPGVYALNGQSPSPSAADTAKALRIATRAAWLAMGAAVLAGAGRSI